MVWTCVAANTTGPLVFINIAIADRSGRISSKVCEALISAEFSFSQKFKTDPRTLQFENG